MDASADQHNPDSTWPPQRRVADVRIAQIEKRMGVFEGLLAENTAATKAGAETVKEVRDILTTFKTLGTFAKWAGYIVAAIASAWAAIKGVRG